MKTRLLILLFFMGILLYSADYSTTAEASAKNSSYKFLNIGEVPIKTGKYYLKCSIENGRENIYISRKKNQEYEKTPLSACLCCNGKQAYYIEMGDNESYLYKFNLSSGKKSKVKKLGSGEIYWNISAIYKSNIYITRTDELYMYREDTYRYDIKKGTLSEIKKNCAIIDSHGKYAVSCDKLYLDITPYPVSLWKFTASGMKKIKSLVKFGRTAVFIKNKIYYVSYTNLSGRKMVLYQCNLKGSNKKKIAIFETSNVNGIFITEITEKSCIVYTHDEKYRYVYKSGKKKKL